MEVKVKLSALLLVLSCLVQSAFAEETPPPSANPPTAAPAATTTIPTTPGPTTPRPTTPRPTTPRPTTVGPTAASSTAPAPTEKKETTRAPSTAAPTTQPQPVPGTTEKTTTIAPAVMTQKPSTPSSGGQTVQQPSITTVSKTEETPAVMPPKSHEHSIPPQASAATTGSAPHAQSTTHPQVPNVPTTGPAQPPAPKGSVTPDQQGPGVTDAPATAATTKEAEQDLKMDVTTKQDDRAAGTSAAVTSKPGPDQVVPGSTAPPRTPPPQTSARAPTATTPGPGPDRPSTTESRVQTSTPSIAASTPAPKTFTYSLNRGAQSEQEKDLVSLCRQLMGNLEDGNCTLSVRYHNGKVVFDSAEITGKVKAVIVTQQFEDITKKPTDNRTLITILASCGALLIMIIILAVCASHHRKPYHENQQHLTDELQTVENGYHDNPTLEVMEVQAVEPEKKLNLNGEFNDSWIVPMDNLLKEEGPDEEDTHL